MSARESENCLQISDEWQISLTIAALTTVSIKDVNCNIKKERRGCNDENSSNV